jgi:hypothetical protein
MHSVRGAISGICGRFCVGAPNGGPSRNTAPGGIGSLPREARGSAKVSDWLHDLPLLWMALVVFGFTYLLSAAIYAIVMVLAVGERARSFKAVSPGMLPPLGIIFCGAGRDNGRSPHRHLPGGRRFLDPDPQNSVTSRWPGFRVFARLSSSYSTCLHPDGSWASHCSVLSHAGASGRSDDYPSRPAAALYDTRRY